MVMESPQGLNQHQHPLEVFKAGRGGGRRMVDRVHGLWERTGLYTAAIRPYAYDLLGVAVAAGGGAAAGAFAHGLWRDAGGVDTFAVSPVLHLQRVPRFLQLFQKPLQRHSLAHLMRLGASRYATAKPTYDEALYGDGGVKAVQNAAKRSTNLELDLKEAFRVRPVQRVGGVLYRSPDALVSSGLARDGYPKRTQDAHFMWMAKHLGQPIVLFSPDATDPQTLRVRTAFPCVVYDSDTAYTWTVLCPPP